LDQQSKSICGVLKANGTPCQSRVRIGTGPCAWHARTFGQRLRSWARNQTLSFALTVFGALIGVTALGGWAYDELFRPHIRGFLQVESGFTSWKLNSTGVSLNIGLHNRGDEPIDNVYYHFEFSLVQIAETDETDRMVREKFRKAVTETKVKIIEDHVPGTYVGKNDSIWTSLTMKLSDDDIAQVLRGTRRMYLNVWAQWPEEQHDLEFCEWLQPPETNDLTNSKLVWHICTR
jgi:hypothetical protein